MAIHNHGPGDKVYPTPESIYEKVRDLDPRDRAVHRHRPHRADRRRPDRVDAARFADRLLDVHIKDVSAAEPKGNTVEIGRGVIDIPGFPPYAPGHQLRGVVSFEHEKDEKDPLAGLAESVGFVRGALATLQG